MSEFGGRGLTDEDIAALNYEMGEFDRGFMLGSRERDYTIEDYMQLATYEIGEQYMRISDSVWGEEIIGDKPYDQLLIKLARTPLFRRLQSIEQLTLGPQHATMPNSMYFSRWQHIWGSVVFVRKMMDGDERFDDRQKMVFQLRTLLSDVGHTAFSHLGDWMFQGKQGGEDQHDQDLKDILRVSGIEEILNEYGISVDETAFPEVSDWIECPSPDLCVDRVDYGMREILRWVSPSVPMNMLLMHLKDPKSLFEIENDGRLVMKHEIVARYYAAGFSILPTEHWAHPVHRLQLNLFQHAVQSAVVEKAAGEGTHPRDAMYGVDNDFYAHFQTWEMIHLQHIMKGIGLAQRFIFTSARRADLGHIFSGITDEDWEFPEFPNPLESYSWQSEKHARPYPPNIDIEEITGEIQEYMEATERGLVVMLPPLKARAIDPPVKGEDGTVRTLSQIDPSYATYLKGQRAMMAKSYKATVLMRSDIAGIIVAAQKEAEQEWARLLQRQRSVKALAWIIRTSESTAAAHSFDRIRESTDGYIKMAGKLGVQGELFGL